MKILGLGVLLVACSTSWAAGPEVVFSEILYNPPASLGSDESFELVELHNRGTIPADIGGWLFKDEGASNLFEVASGVVIAPGGYLVIARNLAAFRSAYGAAVPAVGGFDFALANGGGTVRLLDGSGVLVDQVEYDDDPPWPVEADGGGSTLERVDASRDVDDFTNFAASAPSSPPGTPGLPNSRRGARPPRFEVILNEISYNPVREPGVDPLRHCEAQEYVEIHNRSRAPIDISGWSFGAGIMYRFPPGAILPGGGFIAVFKDETEFKARYPDPSIASHGPFGGVLDNGGEGLLLLDAAGEPVDFVDYDDRVPWPVNPDGLEGTLELVDPFSDNERGRSWEESADFAGTPGARNSATQAFEARGANATPDITLVEARSAQAGDRENILSGDEVRVTARIQDSSGIDHATAEYQVLPAGSYIRKGDPEFDSAWERIPMSFNPRTALFEALLPKQPHRTLVRYRVRAADASPAALESTAPRAGDPEPNFAYFVYDGIPSYTANVQSEFGPAGFVHTGLEKLPVYHMIGSGDDIRNAQYVIRDWQDDTYRWLVTIVYYWVDPAGGAVETRVHDHVQMRLKGGVHRYHWPKRGWKLKFNRGNYFSGRFNDGEPYPRKRSHLHLTSAQHNDGRPRGESGVFETLAWRLFRDAGVTASSTTFVQLRVVDAAEELDQYAGDFFGIFLDVERVDATLLKNLGLPADDSAGLYKIDGGPEKVHPDCTPSTAEADAFIRGYTSINTPEWYRANFDLEKYFSFRSVVEFSHHYDMGSKNHYYYHNTTTGLWEMVPWDLDNTFGSDSGDGSEPFNTRVLPKFPAELKSRMRFLYQTLFTQDRMGEAIDEWRPLIREVADADMDRWNAGPDCLSTVPGNRGNQCGFYQPFETHMTALKTWIRARRGLVETMFRDASIPSTPSNEKPLPGGKPALPITLAASPFSDPEGDVHVLSHWLVVEAGTDWAFPLWEELTKDSLTSIVPSRAGGEQPLFVLGRSYEHRVRYQDATGRWSFLSEPTRFTVGVDDPSPPTPPGTLRAVLVSARAVVLEWGPASDPETGVSGYYIFRDGRPLTGAPIPSTRFTDRAPLLRHQHVYTVTALNAPGRESVPSNAVDVAIPEGNFGGWAGPEGGFDYLYDAGPGEDAFVADKSVDGCLDGTWSRSLLTDNWAGTKPGHGPPPGGVEVDEVPGAAEDGGAATVLSIEDPGNPTGEGIPPDNNRRIFLVHRLGAANPFAEGAGLTLAARFRVNPSPRDLAPSSQEPTSFKGQVGVARYVSTSALRRHFSVALNQEMLTFPGASLPARMFELQSIWVTIAKESDNAGDEIYRVRVYRDGSPAPAFDQAMSLALTGTESVGQGAPSTYLELGLTDSAAPGAIQVDFVAYKLGALPPVPAATPGLFVRGDADSSGKLEITDAIYALRHLFQGGPGFACADAADTDDSGEVGLTDAVVTLRFLFQGGIEPSPPFPRCGADETEDGLEACAAGRCP